MKEPIAICEEKKHTHNTFNPKILIIMKSIAISIFILIKMAELAVKLGVHLLQFYDKNSTKDLNLLWVRGWQMDVAPHIFEHCHSYIAIPLR